LPGDYTYVPITVQEPSMLSYKVSVMDGYDVAFSVVHESTEDGQPMTQVLVEEHRCSDEEGAAVLPSAGICSLCFSNQFSWVRGKTFSYEVLVAASKVIAAPAEASKSSKNHTDVLRAARERQEKEMSIELKLEKLNIERQAKEKDLSVLESEKETLVANATGIKQKISGLETELQDIEKKLDETTTEMRSTDSEIAELTLQLDTVQAEMDLENSSDESDLSSEDGDHKHQGLTTSKAFSSEEEVIRFHSLMIKKDWNASEGKQRVAKAKDVFAGMSSFPPSQQHTPQTHGTEHESTTSHSNAAPAPAPKPTPQPTRIEVTDDNVEMVMLQTGRTEKVCREALTKHNNDVVNAILELAES